MLTTLTCASQERIDRTEADSLQFPGKPRSTTTVQDFAAGGGLHGGTQCAAGDRPAYVLKPIGSNVRYHGVEADDALEMSEQTEI